GAIFPGLRLMARALNDYTALLPLVSLESEGPAMPATSTPGAIKAGILSAVTGGVRALIERLQTGRTSQPEVFLTGGDGPVVAHSLRSAVLWPEMTLEGIRLAAEHLPKQ